MHELVHVFLDTYKHDGAGPFHGGDCSVGAGISLVFDETDFVDACGMGNKNEFG